MIRGHKISSHVYKLLGNTILSGAAAVTKSEDDDTLLWHMRLGHTSERGMRELHKRNLLVEIKSVNWISANIVLWESSVGCDLKLPHTRQRVY